MRDGASGSLRWALLCSGLIGLSQPARAEGPAPVGPTPSAATDARDARGRTGDDGEPEGYRPLVEQAVREYDLAHFEEAHTLFKRAHALFPNARTLRGLGKTEFELRHYRASVDLLQRALASQVRPLDARLRADTEELAARARSFLGALTIETEPFASELRVDDEPLAPSRGPILLQVGEHVIEVRRPGYANERRRIRVSGNQVERVSIVFAHPERPGERPAERPWRRSPWLWTAVGVVAAGAATGIALSLGRSGSERAPYDRGTRGTLGTAP